MNKGEQCIYFHKHSKICSTNMNDRLLCAHSGIGATVINTRKFKTRK